VRPGSGRQPYRLRVRRGGTWSWLPTRMTTSSGFFTVSVRAAAGSAIQVYAPREERFGATVVVR
jgi:hypothetical protein